MSDSQREDRRLCDLCCRLSDGGDHTSSPKVAGQLGVAGPAANPTVRGAAPAGTQAKDPSSC
jgi:hypothetical protein